MGIDEHACAHGDAFCVSAIYIYMSRVSMCPTPCMSEAGAVTGDCQRWHLISDIHGWMDGWVHAIRIRWEPQLAENASTDN